MTQWANFVGYQLVWFAAVCGASRSGSSPAVLAVVLFAAWQLTFSRERRTDIRLVLAALLLGVVFDGTLSATGVLHYSAGAPALPPGGAPLWILALWGAFGLTLNHSLRWLAGRLFLSLTLGAAGGPVAYAAAARLGAVSFAAPAWHGVLWLALGWSVSFAVLGTLASHWRGSRQSVTGPVPS